MKKIFYEKVGGRYKPVYEYDQTLMDAFPKGTHVTVCYPGGQSTRYNIDPNYAAMIAAGTPCPVDGKIGAQAREEWDRRGVNATDENIGFYAVAAPRTVEAVPAPAAVREGCDYTGDDPIVMARVCGQ